jgi:magnesium transporter
MKTTRMKKYSPPGTPPGTLMDLSESFPEHPKPSSSEIHWIEYSVESFSEKKVTDIRELIILLSARKKGNILWLNIDGLKDIELIEIIGRNFSFHPLLLEDILNTPQRPKVENHEKYIFIAMRMPMANENFESEQLSIFLSGDFIITFQEIPGDPFEPVREGLRKDRGKIRKEGSDFLFYTLIDRVIDEFFPILEKFGERVDNVEEEVIEKPEEENIKLLHKLRGEILSMRRVIFPTREVVNHLIREDSDLVQEKTKIYLRDCYDHAVEVLDIVENYREILSGLIDVYLSSLSYKMNQVMKLLTIIATIFIPLTFLAGVYGMNFNTEKGMFNMPELNWEYGYIFFWLMAVLITGILLLFFKRKKWL